MMLFLLFSSPLFTFTPWSHFPPFPSPHTHTTLSLRHLPPHTLTHECTVLSHFPSLPSSATLPCSIPSSLPLFLLFHPSHTLSSLTLPLDSHTQHHPLPLFSSPHTLSPLPSSFPTHTLTLYPHSSSLIISPQPSIHTHMITSFSFPFCSLNTHNATLSFPSFPSPCSHIHRTLHQSFSATLFLPSCVLPPFLLHAHTLYSCFPSLFHIAHTHNTTRLSSFFLPFFTHLNYSIPSSPPLQTVYSILSPFLLYTHAHTPLHYPFPLCPLFPFLKHIHYPIHSLPYIQLLSYLLPSLNIPTTLSLLIPSPQSSHFSSLFLSHKHIKFFSLPSLHILHYPFSKHTHYCIYTLSPLFYAYRRAHKRHYSILPFCLCIYTPLSVLCPRLRI
ncbi:uncharacterized protein LOC119868422 isoform X1 [Canis lupus familiaris]|uniref:uncharacterized protein LOC119868422 isoform X1 n=1 Tax=Canis lupus familiaris TaxID=9615 RepID=UPI0015F12C22|nr:uncharacterized protein LOC119868422 isoform X1 [Canis lupus familiaris]XP_038305625.1 uncharacterized protein LOC119868422 isoform X1 [Canis lupus familiaris]XP_038305626.1 uncharacterized protein LOC119868422 isoform X1 [Canis lupus familiaris]XP_038305627.1 uncharacterized protein LOC119868422 isoform X1 [Canis lupus familiaris]XP_038305628.1 uncharacterized protein LOC119868422 isoform X1 [Canis lupus familiaris]XP_038443040.1 uncharacterized protein LOC119868422 isoform X1 [Canis lupus